jgi:hypothetical protein
MFFWSSFASAFLKACSSSGKATVLPEMALDETFANFRKRGRVRDHQPDLASSSVSLQTMCWRTFQLIRA